jgi:hypothetical protein
MTGLLTGLQYMTQRSRVKQQPGKMTWLLPGCKGWLGGAVGGVSLHRALGGAAFGGAGFFAGGASSHAGEPHLCHQVGESVGAGIQVNSWNLHGIHGSGLIQSSTR